MELIIYNRENASTSRAGQKTVNVYIHGGVISLSSSLAKELKLQEGASVFFAQQKSNSKNWFLTIADSDDLSAFKLSKSDNALLFRNTGMARKILMSFKEPKNIRFLVTGDTQEEFGKVFYQLVPIVKKTKS